MNELTTYRWTFDEDIRRYIAAGFDGIGVWRDKLSDFGEERGIELLRDSPLRVSSLLWAGGFTGNEGRTHREGIDDGLEALRVAAALGADCLVVYTGGRGGHTINHARRLTRAALAELGDAAAALGVTLALEPMHIGCACDWTFLTSLDEALDLVQDLPCSAIKLAFDTYHLGHCASILERIEGLISYVAIVQLGDARHAPCGEQDRCCLGDGRIPLGPIVRRLLAAGYDGYFDVELMGQEIEGCDYDHILRRSVTAVRQLLAAAG